MSNDNLCIKNINDCINYDIVEVYQTEYASYANSRLEQGWKLLRTFTTCYDPNIFYDHQSINYVLGRPSNIEPFKDE